MNRHMTKFLSIAAAITLTSTSVFSTIPASAGNTAPDGTPVTDTTSGNSAYSGQTVSENTSDSLEESGFPAYTEDIADDNASEFFTTSGTTLTVTAANGMDITKALQAALTKAGELATSSNIYTVVVPGGTYTLTGCLHIYSNTTLSLYGATLKQDTSASTFNMLTFGDFDYIKSSACAGYTGFENISILGGTFTASDGHDFVPIRMMHATNVTLKDVTVGGGESDHLVEVVALKNFLVDGCTFKDMSASTKTGTREALQLDIAVSDSIYPDIYQDGTMMQDVTIQNCTFTNVSRGIGTHSELVNAYHENIKIINNTFTDIELQCIVCVNYYNVEISGNTMKRCGSGILTEYSKSNNNTLYTTTQNGTVRYSGTQRTDSKTVIRDNVIQTRYSKWCTSVAGIEASGRNITSTIKSTTTNSTIPAADYYIEGIEITNNKITTAGYGILLQDAKNCSITGNQITGAGYSSSDAIAKEQKYSGIHSGQASTGNVFKNNTISSVQSNGFLFQGASGASEITGNTISSCGRDGISISDSGKITGSITGNTIKNCKEHGISISNKSIINGDIADNIISSSAMNGIYLSQNAVCNGDIKGNTISNSETNGICIGNSSTLKSGIVNNTVTGSKKTGIQVISKSSVALNIEGNTVSDSTVNGIGILTSSTVGGSIINNTVSTSGKTGIQLTGKAVVNNKIQANTVTGSSLNGIAVMTSSKVKKGIESNKVKKAKKYGIYVYGKSTVGGNIAGNRISSTNTPIITDTACSVSIRQNTMTKNKNNVSRIATTSIQNTSVKDTAFTSASGKGKKITLKWKKSKGVDGYYVELSTKEDFSVITKKITTTSTNAVFNKLKKGKTYYVRISTYKKSGKAYIYSKYSKTKKIKIS